MLLNGISSMTIENFAKRGEHHEIMDALRLLAGAYIKGVV
jgi:hypothetical protein